MWNAFVPEWCDDTWKHISLLSEPLDVCENRQRLRRPFCRLSDLVNMWSAQGDAIPRRLRRNRSVFSSEHEWVNDFVPFKTSHTQPTFGETRVVGNSQVYLIRLGVVEKHCDANVLLDTSPKRATKRTGGCECDSARHTVVNIR